MRLIDADALLETMKEAVLSSDVDRVIIIGHLSYAPTVEERKHGHWIIGRTAVSGRLTSTCSVCNNETTGKVCGEIKHIFMGNAVACPLCGALMDGKEE